MKKNMTTLLNELVSCGNRLVEIAQAMKEGYEEKPTEAKPEPPKAEPDKQAYTKAEVRTALADKAKAEDKKYKDAVKALVEKYSSDGSFSGIPEEKYGGLMTELKEVGNA